MIFIIFLSDNPKVFHLIVDKSFLNTIGDDNRIRRFRQSIIDNLNYLLHRGIVSETVNYLIDKFGKL